MIFGCRNPLSVLQLRVLSFERPSTPCFLVPFGFIGKRLKALRRSKSISQETLAQKLGFKHRQIVSAIETGHRRMSVDEILRTAEVLNVSAECFTDPFRLDGEGDFTWRFYDKKTYDIQGLETRIGSWIAAFRELAKRRSVQPSLLHHSL